MIAALMLHRADGARVPGTETILVVEGELGLSATGAETLLVA